MSKLINRLADDLKTSSVVLATIEDQVLEVEARLAATEDGKLLKGLLWGLKIAQTERSTDDRALRNAALFAYDANHDKRPHPHVTITVVPDGIVAYVDGTSKTSAVAWAKTNIPVCVEEVITDRKLLETVIRKLRPSFAVIADRVGVRISSKLKKV